MSFDKNTISKIYQDHIFANVPLENGYPAFDLLYLGMGTDGHIGSIFKENISSCLQKEAVKFIERKNDLDRITMTFPTIKNAKKRIIVFLSNEKFSLFNNVKIKKTELPITEIYNYNDSVWKYVS